MSAIGPYSQSYDFRHMYEFSDLRGQEIRKYNANSISGYIMSKPEFSLFALILEKSGLSSFYDNIQEDATLFIVSDANLEEYRDRIRSLDRQNAMNIIKKSTLDKRIPLELLRAMYTGIYPTKGKYHTLLIECEYSSGKIKIDRYSTVIEGNIECGNGLIHIVDKMIIPEFES
jgi:hypothetical protein